jgi:HK97 gp10 family phage protein
MPEETTVEVKGLDELRRNLDLLGEKIATKGIRSALRVSGRVFVDAMKQLVSYTGGRRPTDAEGKERRHLRESLRVRTKVDKYGDCKAFIGPTRKLAHKANWLEFGTQPHIIRAKSAKALLIAGSDLVWEVQHPGAVAKPFIRPAFDGNWEKALAEFQKELAKFIEGHST